MLLVLFLLFTESVAGDYTKCDETLSVKHGEATEIKSFNYPGQYPADQRCIWRFSSPPNTRIFLTCGDLHQPKEPNCVMIKIDGAEPPNELDDRRYFCRAEPFSVRSEDSTLTMIVENNLNSAPGEPFKCYATIDYQNCDYIFHLEDEQGSSRLFSPNYPNNHTGGSSCRWKITSPPRTKIFLSCANTVQPEEERCGGQMIVSLDGNDTFPSYVPETPLHCRHEKFSETSISNQMAVIYQTVRNSAPGFPFSCSVTVLGATYTPCKCGGKNTKRIIGGENVDLYEFSMIASLEDPKTSKAFCAGTIISDHWLLTTARCLSQRTLKDVVIRIGDSLVSKPGHITVLKIVEAESWILHEDFDSTGENNNNIALIQIKDKMEFDNGPACLPFENWYHTLAHESMLAIGWETNIRPGPDPKYLQKLAMRILPDSQCPFYLYKNFSSETFCAEADGKQILEVDEGGPAVWLDPIHFRWNLLGLLWGTNGTLHQITRVSNYLHWIQENAKGALLCSRY